MLENFRIDFERNRKEVGEIVKSHSFEIDELEKTAIKHDARIKNLEKGERNGK